MVAWHTGKAANCFCSSAGRSLAVYWALALFKYHHTDRRSAECSMQITKPWSYAVTIVQAGGRCQYALGRMRITLRPWPHHS